MLNEGIARWQLATGTTVVEGWAEHLPAWVNVYFGAYLVLWTVAVSAALTNATGLGIANLTGGAISQPWGAVAHSLFGFAFVWFGGYSGFEKLMKTLVAHHGLQHPDLRDPDAARSAAGPARAAGADDSRRQRHLCPVDHRRHRRLDHDAVLQLLDARGEDRAGRACLGYVRGDVAIAYLFTALFGISIMLIANQAFFRPGVTITDAQAVPKMAEMLGTMLGPFGVYAYSVGFWAAVFASLLGVWQSVPYLYADFYGIVRKAAARGARRS